VGDVKYDITKINAKIRYFYIHSIFSSPISTFPKQRLK
jgi:hypothetical protein